MTFQLPGGAIAHARFEVKWQDAWIGVFWKSTPVLTDDGPRTIATDVWAGLVPCVPLHVTIWWPVTIPFDGRSEGETLPGGMKVVSHRMLNEFTAEVITESAEHGRVTRRVLVFPERLMNEVARQAEGGPTP